MIKKLTPDTKDLGGFSVKRILPNREKAMVGPFLFFDHFGPAEFQPGSGINVRPHPHIGLATITYLFEGSIIHRDNLGFVQEIFPGDVNWMTAGQGIVHSERETVEVRSRPHTLEGIQCWTALPPEKAEVEPSFVHLKNAELPCVFREHTMMRVIVGDAYGRTSPVITYSPMFYVDVVAQQGAEIEHPNPEQEAAVFVQRGRVRIGEHQFGAGEFVLWASTNLPIVALDNARLLLLGGDKFEQRPHLYWNFVAWNKERLEQAKQQWREGQFHNIPNDAEEFIPLPEE